MCLHTSMHAYIYTHTCVYIYIFIYLLPLFGKPLLSSFACFSIGKHANHKITEFVFLTPSKFTFVLIYNYEISNQLLFALLIFTKIHR